MPQAKSLGSCAGVIFTAPVPNFMSTRIPSVITTCASPTHPASASAESETERRGEGARRRAHHLALGEEGVHKLLVVQVLVPARGKRLAA